MIVGVTGTICSGKGKVSRLFKDKGFVHHSLSSEIRQIAKERGIEINRKNLTELGALLRKESPAESVLGRRVLDKIEKEVGSGKERFVVEGIRDPDEIQLFRKHEFEGKAKRFVLIWVDAPQDMRWERMKARGRQGEPETFEDFKKVDAAEMEAGGGQELAKCREMADYTIQNDSTFDGLEQNVEEIAKELM